MKKLAVLLLAVTLLGCKDPYGASEKAALDIGNGIAAGMKTADDLRVTGKISQQVHSSGAKTGYTVCAVNLQQTLSNPTELALIHVSNPTSQQNVMVIVNGINTGVSTLLAALGGQ
jgi:hypothetical protein